MSTERFIYFITSVNKGTTWEAFTKSADGWPCHLACLYIWISQKARARPLRRCFVKLLFRILTAVLEKYGARNKTKDTKRFNFFACATVFQTNLIHVWTMSRYIRYHIINLYVDDTKINNSSIGYIKQSNCIRIF